MHFEPTSTYELDRKRQKSFHWLEDLTICGVWSLKFVPNDEHMLGLTITCHSSKSLIFNTQ